MANRFGVSKDGKVVALYDTKNEAVQAAPTYDVDPKKDGAIVELDEKAQKAALEA